MEAQAPAGVFADEPPAGEGAGFLSLAQYGFQKGGCGGFGGGPVWELDENLLPTEGAGLVCEGIVSSLLEQLDGVRQVCRMHVRPSGNFVQGVAGQDVEDGAVDGGQSINRHASHPV